MQAVFEPHDTQAEKTRLVELFSRQQAAHAAEPYPSEALRRDRLARLRQMLLKHMDSLCAAVSADFGHRSVHETKKLDLFPTLAAIRHAEQHLRRWMKPQRRGVSIWFMPASNSIVPQPVGVIGIITPWNYPLLLSARPLASAFAAGNRAVIKMSEFTPNFGEAFRRAFSEFFDESEVAVINGGVEVAQAFTGLPWNHLLFTGSTAVGKVVMRAAAEHLTPVTLELGGKSPTIIHADFPLALAAQRILYGKSLNAGQTCVAPDYVFLPEGKQAEFEQAARLAVQSAYPNIASNPDYSAVVNRRHLERLHGYLRDAEQKGARVVPLADCDPASGKLAPTLVFGATEDMQLLQEEIFGPILPVLGYQDLAAVIDYVNARPRPLALYYFDYDNRRIGQMLSATISGGVGINETVLHFGQNDLPVGGVGASGMGNCDAREGFETFSKMKPVFAQSRLNGVKLLYPPYGKRVNTLLKFMLR